MYKAPRQSPASWRWRRRDPGAAWPSPSGHRASVLPLAGGCALGADRAGVPASRWRPRSGREQAVGLPTMTCVTLPLRSISTPTWRPTSREHSQRNAASSSETTS